MNIYTFNENNPSRTNWKKDIDNNNLMRLLNEEVAVNSFKSAKWITQCLLGDIDYIMFAMISRK